MSPGFFLQIHTVWVRAVWARELPPTNNTGGDPVRVVAIEAASITAVQITTNEEAVCVRKYLVEVLHLHPRSLRVRAWNASRVTLLCLDALSLLEFPGSVLESLVELGVIHRLDQEPTADRLLPTLSAGVLAILALIVVPLLAI